MLNYIEPNCWTARLLIKSSENCYWNTQMFIVVSTNAFHVHISRSNERSMRICSTRDLLFFSFFQNVIHVFVVTVPKCNRNSCFYLIMLKITIPRINHGPFYHRFRDVCIVPTRTEIMRSPFSLTHIHYAFAFMSIFKYFAGIFDGDSPKQFSKTKQQNALCTANAPWVAHT